MLTAVGLWDFLTEPAALVVIGVTLAVAWPLGRRLADRCRCRRDAAVLFVVAVGMIVALTLTPGEPSADIPLQRPPHFLQHLDDGRLIWAKFVAPPVNSEERANIAIYLPVGFLGRLVWGSAVRAIGFGLVLTLFVETCQYAVIGRAGSITDIRNNALGALIGALIAATIVYGRRRRAEQSAS